MTVWTPKRIMLLAVGFLVFTLVYVVYAATSLGRINTLPPLPEEYKIGASNKTIRPVTSGHSPLELKMRQAFGPECKELSRPIRLELNAKSMVMAAEKFEFCKDARGRVFLPKLSLAIFGKKKDDGREIEINTLRSEQAYITFDRPVTSLNEISGRKVVEAELFGEIVIVNNRRTTQRDDDLSVNIDKGPLYYIEKDQLIWTDDAIHLRDGQLYPPKADIRAKGMKMELATAAPPPKPGTVPVHKPKNESISGLKRIILEKDVTMHLYVAGQTPFPSNDQARSAPARSTNAPKPPAERSHIVIGTPGRFRYELFKDHDMAYFDVPEEQGQPNTPQDVTVERTDERLGNDQLVCKHLELRLKRRDSGPAPAGKTKTAQNDEQSLEIETAHATKEVTLTSDAEKLTATGDDFFYDTAKKLTILKGSPQMEAQKDESIIHAREMQIQDVPLLVPPGSPPKSYQRVIATGPGEIHLPKKVGDKTTYTTHAFWNDRLTSTRDGEHDLLVLTGSARFKDDEHEQEMQAETLKVWLLTEDKKLQPAEKKPQTGAKTSASAEQGRRPHHLEALRNVRARSPELVVHDTRRLVVWFQDVKASEMPGPAPGSAKPAVRPGTVPAPAGTAARVARGPQAAATPAPAPKASQPAGIPAPGRNGAPAGKANEEPRPIHLSAQSVEATVLRCGERNALDKLHTEGLVRVHQAPANPGEKGVDIEGETLDMKCLPAGNYLVVTGDDELAKLRMDKMFILGPDVHIDQTTNKAWVHGSGAMMIDSETNLEGKPLGRTVPLTVHWSEGMLLNGGHAEFSGGIQAEQENARLACQHLQVFFDRPISLKEGNRGDQPAKIRNLVGDKEVRVEDKVIERGRLLKYQLLEGSVIAMNSEPRDEEGPGKPDKIKGPRPGKQEKSNDSHEVRLSGPGSVRIWQPGGADLAAAPAKTTVNRPGDRSPVPADQEMKLTYVSFLQRMDASNKTNTASFWGDVRVLNFPCEEKDLHREINLDTMLAELPLGAMYMRCARLKVRGSQQPGGQRNQEMEAHGRVDVRAKEFWARADHVYYNEAKDQIIFVADPGNLATWAKIVSKGQDPQTLQGKKVIYLRSKNKAWVEEGDSLNGG